MDYDELYQLILNDELGWEHLITYIVREEQMNPLDIDIVKITDRFNELILNSKIIDFRFGGKFIYTAAILLKMKSDFIVDEILQRKKEASEKGTSYIKAIPADIVVVPRLPINRKRQISLSELIQAIRTMIAIGRKPKMEFRLKLKEVRIQDKMIELLERLSYLFRESDNVTFSMLLTRKDREDVVYTFISLILLATQRKVYLRQDEPFGEIYVRPGLKAEN